MAADWSVAPTFLFDPEPAVRDAALRLYAGVESLGLICPHGHVSPELLADPQARFANPTDLLLRRDHYLFRLLYSRGVPLEQLGVGAAEDGYDPRAAWGVFCEHFHLFDGTPSGLWLRLELTRLFGVTSKPDARNASAVYDQLQDALGRPEFTPRALFRRFGIELLATTDAAEDSLTPHLQAQQDGFAVIPTFRPDALLDVHSPGWTERLARLSEASGVATETYASFLEALRRRRAAFRAAGATASDHSAPNAQIAPLDSGQAERLFALALAGKLSAGDAAALRGHALFDQARLSAEEDGLVMQLHLGVTRNHNAPLYHRFGADMGADIPHGTEWTAALRPLLNAFGNDPRFQVIVFTLDESSYSRELAPLAGHYPALLLGPPWWFHDSVLGIERYLNAVSETATLHNTAGFNDDTRAFVSIPARHELWRRTTANWLARRVARGLLDEDEAARLLRLAAYDLARRAYRLDEPDHLPTKPEQLVTR